MRRYESPVFGEVVEPASVKELLAWIDRDRRRDSDGERRPYLWRGQSDISWPVHSTAFRRLASSGRPASENDIAHMERNLLKQARHRGYGEIDGHELSDFDLLARLRHHGAATRLVDATRSAVVGLWFAVAEHMTATGALIGLHTDTLGGYEREPEDRPYDEVVKKLDAHDYAITWEPPGVSARIAAQHSQFLYSSVANATTGSLRMGRAGSGSTVIAAITPDLKREVIDTLNRVFDISPTTLFPDFDGFARSNSVQAHRDEMWRW